MTSAFFPERSLTGSFPAGALAPLPALGEEVEVDVLLGVGFDDLLVQLDAEAGTLGELEVAVSDFREAWGRLADPGVGEVVEVLLNAEVRGAGGEVEGCGGVDLASDVMRGDGHVVSVGPRCELLRLQEPADVAYVGLDHISSLKLEDLPVLVALVDALARGDGRLYTIRSLLQRFQVDRRHGFLDPAESEGLEHPGHLYCGSGRETAVHLQQDLYLWSYRIADGLDERDGLYLLLVLQLVVSWTERIQLQRPVPALYDLLRSLVELLGRALDPVPAVGVGLDPVPYGPAKQVVDGLVERLADDIPTSRLEDGDAAAHHLAGAREVVAAHLLDQLLYPERVVPDEVPRGRLGQVPDQGVRVVDHPRLSEACQSLVRVGADDGQVAPLGADDERVYVGYLHAFSFTSASTGKPGNVAPGGVVSASG